MNARSPRVEALRGVADEAFRAGALEVPDFAARAGI
jgi:hypothetical protein